MEHSIDSLYYLRRKEEKGDKKRDDDYDELIYATQWING